MAVTYNLPFKGFTKPIYAIPGNHDWYDALEAFAAHFLEPDAARACMSARMKVDGWWTTTNPRHIEAKIDDMGLRLKSFHPFKWPLNLKVTGPGEKRNREKRSFYCF